MHEVIVFGKSFIAVFWMLTALPAKDLKYLDQVPYIFPALASGVEAHQALQTSSHGDL
jgi:hypothetical protein